MTGQPGSSLHPWSRATLWLAAIAVVLLLLDRWPESETSVPRLTQIDVANTESLRVERGNRLQLALRQGSDGWRLVHPLDVAARPERIAQLLAVARAPVRYSFDADVDPAVYGFAPAVAVLRLDDTTIQFGNREPSQSGRYVMANGRVHVIDEVYFNLLSLPPDHFTGD